MTDNIEYIGCPFCNGISYCAIWKENGWIGNKCDDCGLIYVSPRPTTQYMKELYENGENKGMTDHDHFHYHYSDYLLHKWILKQIKKYGKREYHYLLELGSGGGMFLRQSEMEGYTSYGMEINDNQRYRLKNEFNLYVFEDWVDIPKQSAYDIIFHKNVLSHLHDPLETFKKCHEVLYDDGYMIFITGNGGNLNQKWLKRLKMLGYPEHLFLFSNKALHQLIEQSGFEVVNHHTIPKIRDILPFFSPFGHGKITSNTTSSEKTDFKFTVKEKIRGFFSYILNYWVGRLFSKKLPSNIILILRKRTD